VSAKGGNVVVEFETSHDWVTAVRINASETATNWYGVEGTSGDAGKGKAIVTIKENDSDKYRNLTLVIYATNVLKQTEATVEITQRPKGDNSGTNPDPEPEDEIIVYSEFSNVISSEGESMNIDFSASGEWSANSTAEWCSVEPASGAKGDSRITLSFRANSTYESRNATVKLVCGKAEESFEFTQEAAVEKGPLELSIAADYRGPDFLFTIVEVTNTTNAAVSAEIGILASTQSTMANPKSGTAGAQEIAAGKTEKFEVTTPNLSADTGYYIQAYAKIGDKTYVSDYVSSCTVPLKFYISQDKSYNYSEQAQTLNLCLISNVPFEDPVISAEWISLKSYTEEHYKYYNYYTFEVAENSDDKDRDATITFASSKYNVSEVVSIHQTKKIATTGVTAGHEWVNLALPSGTLWASMNVGAEKPEECGRYVAWGESVIMGEEDKENEYNYKHYNTYVKENYSSNSYKFYHDEEFQEGDNVWGAGKTNVLHKYYKDDGLMTLEAKDDAATVKWGTEWTMPTYEQVLELIRNTKYAWTENYKDTGVAGGIFYRLKSAGASYTTDDTHIFIPASGYGEWQKYSSVGDFGQIWAKTVTDAKVSTNPYHYVWTLSFNSREADFRSTTRTQGLCVRPVVK